MFRTEYEDDDYVIQNGIEDEVQNERHERLLGRELGDTKLCDDKARGQDYYKRFPFFSILKPLLSAPSRLSQRLEVECRILFPLTFMGFCLCYWIYYCHIMDESEAIMENVTMYKIHDEN